LRFPGGLPSIPEGFMNLQEIFAEIDAEIFRLKQVKALLAVTT
jgi:hypothetical protein